MLFTKKKLFFILFSLCICFFAFIPFTQTMSNASTYFSTSDIFKQSSYTVESCYIEEYGTNSKGIFLSTSKKNSTVKFAKDFIGKFSMDFSPVVDKDDNPLVSEFTVSFQSSVGEFDVVISYGTFTNIYVVLNGEKVGINYEGIKAKEKTSYANEYGYYTTIYSNRFLLVFDPDDMTVSVEYNDNTFLVCDLSNRNQDRRIISSTLSKFDYYNVSLSINDYVNEGAGVVLFKVNDILLDNIVVSSLKSTIFAKFETNAVVGEEYSLPTGYLFNPYEGATNGVSVSVVNANNKNVEITNGCFVPTSEGNYKVYYKAKIDGVEISKSYILVVNKVQPEFTYDFESDLFDEVFVGKTVYIPKLFVSDGLYYYGEHVANITVIRNGVKQISYTDLTDGFYYTFDSQANYQIVYNFGLGEFVKDVAFNNDAVYFEYSFLDSYQLNDYIDLTSGKLRVNGRYLDYNVKVEYPNNFLYNNSCFVCSQVGKYIITITSSDNTYSTSKEIVVIQDASSLFESSNEGLESISLGQSKFTGKTGVEIVTSGKKTVVNYKTQIDLSKYVDMTEANGNITLPGVDKVKLKSDSKPFIQLSVDPRNYETSAIRNLKIILTDVNDENNKLTIVLDGSKSTSWTYIRAYAGNQSEYGLHNNTGNANNPYTMYSVNYGFMIKHSFTGILASSFQSTSQSLISLYYDYEKKQVLAETAQGGNYNIVCDLDNPDLCNGTPWSGFSSSMVYLSIELGSPSKGNVKCYIYNIDGHNFSLNQTDVVSEPVIDLPCESLVGLKGYSLDIPNAVAYDSNYVSLDYSTFVYYVVGESLYNIKIVNNSFETSRSGKYIIKYVTKDSYGNTATKQIEVTVKSSYNDITAIGNFPAEFGDGSFKTGDKIEVLNDEILSNILVENSIGSYVVSCTVKKGSEIQVLDNNVFQPVVAGDFNIIYTIIDSVGRKIVLNETLKISLGEEPIIVSSIPDYVGFVEGNKYDLFDIYVIDYSKGTSQQKADLFINGSRYNDNSISFDLSEPEAINENETIVYYTLEYRYNGNVLKYNDENLSYTIPLKRVYKKYNQKVGTRTIEKTKFLLDRYFVSNDSNLSVEFDGILLNAENGSTKNATFIQSVPSNDLAFSFDITNEKNSDLSAISTNIKSVVVTLTDVKNKEKTVSFYFITNGENTLFKINNFKGTEVGFNGSLTGMSLNGFSLLYDNEEFKIYDAINGTKLADITQFDDGTVFTGFDDYVHISFALTSETEKDCSIYINSICGQKFSNNISDDNVGPTITVNGTINNRYYINQSFTVPTVSVYDVLSEIDNNSILVSVEYCGESGDEYIITNNGELKNLSAFSTYDIVFDKLGDYRITYTAKDKKGNAVSKNIFIVNVIVEQDPVITISGDVPKSATVNQEIVLPEFNVSFADDNDDNLGYVLYIAPSNKYQYITENKFVATEKGVYRIRYFAVDAYGSYSIKEYSIVVR